MADINIQPAVDGLRAAITGAAFGAVHYGGVDKTWANNWLARLGAQPVGGDSEYRLNLPLSGLYGATVTAGSRAEAKEKFLAKVAKVREAGKINDCHTYGNNVYDLTIDDTEPTFYRGPDDPDIDVEFTTAEQVADGITAMLREGVTTQGWGYRHAQNALEELGLPPLPEYKYRTVEVPVSGTAKVVVAAFEGDDDAQVFDRVKKVAQGGNLVVAPEEIGEPITRDNLSETMGLKLLDDE